MYINILTIFTNYSESLSPHANIFQRDLDRECAQRVRGATSTVVAGVLRSLHASYEGRTEDAHKHYIAALE